jgi:hypothetical protein
MASNVKADEMAKKTKPTGKKLVPAKKIGTVKPLTVVPYGS